MAAELLKTQGKEGIGILRDPQYELNTGDAYIFIIDVEESLVVSNPRFRKISYIYPVPGLRYTVCAGIYDDTMSLDELNRMSGVSAESPKVAVLFEVKPKTEGKEEYLKLAAVLKTELAKMPGFIRVERFASLNEEGK